MNLRWCVLLSVASALTACGLFETGKDRDTDAVEEESGDDDPEGSSDDGDEGDESDSDEPGSTPGTDAARPAREAGSGPVADSGRAPASNPTPTIDGGAPPANRDAGFDWASDGALPPSAHDASASVRDGGLIKFDPDASGPVLNPQVQTACIGLLNNICNRSADCQVSLLGLEANMRTRLFESCRNGLWRARNCNRATSTASGFMQCSESTKNLSCLTLLATDLATTCANQITLQP